MRKELGLVFHAITEDNDYDLYEFETIEDLRREWFSDDPDCPSNDAPIADCELRGVPIYVNCFMDIVKLLGLDQEEGVN